MKSFIIICCFLTSYAYAYPIATESDMNRVIGLTTVLKSDDYQACICPYCGQRNCDGVCRYKPREN